MDLQEQLADILRGRPQRDSISPRRTVGPPLESLVPGHWLESRSRRIYVGENRYATSYRHGSHALRDSAVADAARWPELLFRQQRPFDLAGALYLDTETTGLGRGPGTFCFMVGTGQLEGDVWVTRQYLAPDYGDEPLLLLTVEQQAARATGLVTFNGRAFDLPLLETRYVLNGYERSPLASMGHLDLLPAARRLWSGVLPSCALSALEASLLGVERGEEDVPGYLIPEIYASYLLDGATEDLARVFYHNCNDILSMVTLAAEIDTALSATAWAGGAHPGALVGLARLREADADPEQAVRAYQCAMGSSDSQVTAEARRRLAALLKRQGRMQEAVRLWMEALEEGVVHPFVELAKYYEHGLRDYQEAELLVKRALMGLAGGTLSDPHPERTLGQLTRRLERLRRRQRSSGGRSSGRAASPD